MCFSSQTTSATPSLRKCANACVGCSRKPSNEDVSHGDIGDGFRWDRTIREAGPDDGIEETDAQGNVYRGDVKLAVGTVTVEWEDGSGVKSYAVQTMRIVPDTGENDNGGNNP